jgi:hypothetical protein
MKVGYARVSTREQNLRGQVAELTAAGCAKVFRERASGAGSDRVELMKGLRRLEPGDVLMVTRLDRLARSTRDLLNVLAAVTERCSGWMPAGPWSSLPAPSAWIARRFIGCRWRSGWRSDIGRPAAGLLAART